MKKIIKKISLLLILCSLIAPGYSVWATSEEISGDTGSQEEAPVTLSEDATLSKLEIEGVKFDKDFDPNKFEYKAVVKGDVDSIKIIASPNSVLAELDSSSQTGTQQLKVGDNNFKIKVIAENKKTFEYTITVVRAQSDLNLTKLNIQGQNLNEVFDPEVYEYTADVTNNVTAIKIQTGRPVGTTVSVSGNSNLKVGKNTVIVTVKNEIGDTKEYKIIVTRGDEEDFEDEDASTSEDVVTSESDSEITPVVSVDEDDDKNLDTKNDNTLRSVIIITSTVLLLLIAGLGIYFYVRTGNSEKKRQKKIEKLKRKQAKIEEQLTGLMPVITEEQEQEYLNKNSNKEEEIEEFLEDDEELESTIEIDYDDIKNEEKTRQRRVDKTIFDDDFDDLFDDRDE